MYARLFAVSMLSMVVMFAFAVGVFADAGHVDEAPHSDQVMPMMQQTTDRSDQLPAALMGFVIGIVVGVVAVKFFFTKGA